MFAFDQNTAPAHVAGVGLKPAHYKEALTTEHGLGFFEVHAENFFGAGGSPHRWLSAIREKFDLSIHGVCLSIGAPAPLHKEHLSHLKALVDRYQPSLISEHLAWCGNEGIYHNDLLPTPLNQDSFEFVKDHVNQVQETLGRQILLENPSLYLALRETDMAEPDFLNALAKETGCGLLLDINNVYVSGRNLGFDPHSYCGAIDTEAVKEIHLAGHFVDRMGEEEILVDNHGAPVSEAVLELYADFIARAGQRPTLIEWDTDVPEFAVLVGETQRAMAAVNARKEKALLYA